MNVASAEVDHRYLPGRIDAGTRPARPAALLSEDPKDRGLVNAKGAVWTTDAQDDFLPLHRLSLGNGPDFTVWRKDGSEDALYLVHPAQYSRSGGEDLYGDTRIQSFLLQDAASVQEVDVGGPAGEHLLGGREPIFLAHPSSPPVMRAPKTCSMWCSAKACASVSKEATQSRWTSML